jgi:nucleotide-binding universal stress UspA family protein
VSIVGEKDLSKAIPAAKLAQHLANHGIAATTESVPALKGDAGEALREHAAREDADLIVMDAFVHARLRQWVLGGVTQSMLKRSKIPILMAH